MLSNMNFDLLQNYCHCLIKVSLVTWAWTRSGFISPSLSAPGLRSLGISSKRQKTASLLGNSCFLTQLKSYLLVSTLPLLVPLFLYLSSSPKIVTAELRQELSEMAVGGLGYQRDHRQNSRPVGMQEQRCLWTVTFIILDSSIRASHARHLVRKCAHQSTYATK